MFFHRLGVFMLLITPAVFQQLYSNMQNYIQRELNASSGVISA